MALSARADSEGRPHRHEAPGLVQAGVTLDITTTRPIEFVDLTDALVRAVAAAALVTGTVSVQTRHTTTGLLVNEYEPQLLADLTAMFERLAPNDLVYAHDDFSRRTGPLPPDERRNGHAHCRAALLRTSETVHVSAGVVGLGRWQRVLFVDFDGGQRRQVSLVVSGLGR
jgi:secondary thiamine-phosphate synthase enzyme